MSYQFFNPFLALVIVFFCKIYLKAIYNIKHLCVWWNTKQPFKTIADNTSAVSPLSKHCRTKYYNNNR